MKRKNLERAVVLGLVALSMHGVALAADEYEGYVDLSNTIGNKNFPNGGVVIIDGFGQNNTPFIENEKYANDNLIIKGVGIWARDSQLALTGKNIVVKTDMGKPRLGTEETGIYIDNYDKKDTDILLNADSLHIISNGNDNIYSSAGIRVVTSDGNTGKIKIDLNGKGDFLISGYSMGIDNSDTSKADVNIVNATDINIVGKNDSSNKRNYQYGIHQIIKETEENTYKSNINLSSLGNIKISGFETSIYNTMFGSTLNLKAGNDIELLGNGSGNGIEQRSGFSYEPLRDLSTVIDAGGNIKINNHDIGIETFHGDTIKLTAGNSINITDVNTGIDTSENGIQVVTTKITLESNNNVIVAEDYGVLSKSDSDINIISNKGNNYITANDSALKTEIGNNKRRKDANITVQGNINYLASNELTVYATGKGSINIDGDSLIEVKGDNVVAAVAAGGTKRFASYSNGVVKINKNTDELFNGNTDINGNIVSGYQGDIQIGNGNVINGNLLAANTGKASVDVVGVLNGRVDDYSITKDYDNIYQPVFSTSIIKEGTTTLNMSKNSTWNVTGQSWVTNLVMDNSVVNMTDVNNTNTGNAITVGKISGTGTFNMSLNHDDYFNSDMLYIKSGTGTFNVDVDDVTGNFPLTVDEKLRFATVGNKDIKFDNVSIAGQGIYDLQMGVFNEDYKVDDTENESYNGKELDKQKPGNENINKDFADGTNWYISGVKKQEETPSADVIVDMSRANYANAVYMDRLNKRMGEMRYINDEEDAGLWVRMRHDRVGKDDAFKYKSNMYEIGYDEKQDCDNGKRRVGVAIDYMHGDTTYSNVGGKGEISRKGMWLYDTWLGDKGYYADYVAKWGHLANDYEIYNLKNGDKITGDYDNNVFSLSAEYGRKKDMGSNWYIEPQAQLQYSYVTDADYRTTQGTDVSLDSIHSLIGRAGFRLGKDTDERSTIYFKADMLHEFLGDQDIYACDKTGEMRKTYDNKGTWYDLGFGFATALNKDSYLYADFERSFGNDNDNTWQVNVGANWSF